MKSLLLLLISIVVLVASPLLTADRADELVIRSGQQLLTKGEYDGAYEEFARVPLRFPSSDKVPDARYGMAISSLYGEHIEEAASEFQRIINDFPESPQAARAREMNTIYYRLYIAPISGVDVYKQDTTYSASVLDLDEPAGLAMDSKRNLYLSDKDKRLLYTFDADGKLVNTEPITTAYSVFVTKNDQVWVANNTGAMMPGKTPINFSDATGKVLGEVRSIAVDDAGNFYVLSQQSPGVFVYDKDKKPIPGVSFSRAEEFNKVMVNSRNQVLLMDKDRKRILIFNPDGKSFGTIQSDGKELIIQKIEDFAIDPSNHIYVLTDNPTGVLIFTPSAKLKKWLPASEKGPLIIRDAKLITVAPDGAIFVMDKNVKRVLKVG